MEDASKSNHPKSERVNMLMNEGEGRKRSQSSLGLPTINYQLKSFESTTKTSPSTSINDLPDVVLIEILCRLPCHKFVFRCKPVSKRWCTLITDPYFIGRFVSIQKIYTPKVRTLVNKYGKEFPFSSKLMLPSSSLSFKLPTHAYASMIKSRVVDRHPNPVVVATYKDLFLWCSTKYVQCRYYVCNVYTMQWVALPPTPNLRYQTNQVGFICDIPEHNNAAAECKYKVVRILSPLESYNSFKIIVEIFSSETGEWTESVVSSPRPFQKLDDDFSFVYNGSWLYFRGLCNLLFIGLGPFNFNDNKSSSDPSHHQLRFTVFEQPLDKNVTVWNLGVFKGCVWVATTDDDDRVSPVTVWELKGGEDGNLCLSKQSVYSLDPNMHSNNYIPFPCVMVAFHPNNKDILYLLVSPVLITLNIHTRELSKVVGENSGVTSEHYFTVELPWWPTTIPRLPNSAS